MSIQRYDLYSSQGEGYMSEQKYGDWVLLDDVVKLLEEHTGCGYEHRETEKCFCDAIALVKGENKPFITAKQAGQLTDEMLEE